MYTVYVDRSLPALCQNGKSVGMNIQRGMLRIPAQRTPVRVFTVTIKLLAAIPGDTLKVERVAVDARLEEGEGAT